jgi:pilus assembly protein CpaE
VQVIVVGRADSQLEALLKQPGRTVVSLDGSSAARRKPAAGDVFVIDARGMEHLPPLVASLTRDAADAGFILVCTALDPALMQEGMRAGIRECLAEPLDRAELDAAIDRMAAERAADGLMFAFVGAKGGVGTTTTAVNVALELSRVAPKQTLLVDLHLSNGDAGLFLGEEPRFSVADAIENVHRLDEAFLRSLVVRSKGHLDLLASSDSAVAGPADSGRIRSLLEFASRHYRYTVLDVPRSEPAALEALDPTERIVVVANQELATVRNASRMATILRQRYGKERVAVAVARYDPSAGIGHDDIERAVGFNVKYVLPSDYRRAVEALNSGQPVSVVNDSALAGSFRTMARDLAGLPASDDSTKSSGGFLGFLKGRRN